MQSLSVIILSYAIDDDIFRMNCRCLESLFSSEKWNDGELEVLLVESRKDNPYRYDERVKILIPDEKFNFHRFFNIGLRQTSGELVAFCNNDIVFKEGWYSEILKVKAMNPKFMCFSPMDSCYPMMAELISSGKDFYVGWENKRHYAAWCMVWERKVFDVIGQFDETFDYYSADDDELLTLRKYAIDNVLVAKSEVKHLSQVVTKKDGIDKYKVTDKEKYPLSQKEIKRGLVWLWDDVRFYVAYRRMEAKYGNERMVGRIHRMLEKHPSLRKRFITKFLYNRKVNLILAKLCGI